MDNELKTKLFKGTISTTVGQTITLVFHFLSIFILARFLSKEDFGVYSIFWSVNYILLVLSSIGLDMTVVKYLNEQKIEDKNNLIKFFLLIKLIIILVIIALLIFSGNKLLNFLGEGLDKYNIFIIGFFGFSALKDFLLRVLQGLNFFKFLAIIQVFSALIRLIFFGILIFFDIISLKNIFLVEIFAVVVTVMLQTYSINPRRIIGRIKFNYNIKEIFRFAFPVYLNKIFTFTYGKFNILIIAAYLTTMDVANFDVAQKIPDAINAIFQSFILVFFPTISSIYTETQKEKVKNVLSIVIKEVSALMSVVSLVCILFSAEIITLLFSSKYLNIAPTFTILIISLYIKALENIMGYAILATGNSKVTMNINILSSAISIIGSILLIPHLGFMGVAVAILLMSITAHTMCYLYLKQKNLEPEIMSYIIPVFITLIIALLPQPIINSWPILKVVLMIFYIITILYSLDLKKYMILIRSR